MATAEAKDSSQKEDAPKEQAGGAEPKRKTLEIEKIFRLCMKLGGSDLHLKAGKPPMIRHKGDIRQIELPPLSNRDLERLCIPMLNERNHEIFFREGGADFAFIIGDNEARFRVNMFKQLGNMGLVARLVNQSIPGFDKLFLPSALADVCLHHQGLIILAGVTGSGKSTTIGSMLNFVNSKRRCHILTVEDPIEFVFTDDKAIVNQREVGHDVLSWSIALKHAMRQDPDVILVGEMRDRDTFEAAVHAAETGHLVYGTIHASTAPQTIGRILDLFPHEMHHAIRQTMGFNLKAVICQKLMKTTPEWQDKGISRVPINEIMLCNATVRKAIMEGKDEKIPDYLRSFEHEGMQDFTMALRQRVEAEMVTREAAFEIAPNPDRLKMELKGIRVPT
ncbi:Twitching mobility protein [Planctomycetes bacterium Pan216]|uniref:Twitching mobility protein n=1 Tax=Kolteria novifilia TaxID=2527975 RepID=A0A518AYU8_9BACT|nr:Twitching mobility protein [Planctomycetes bacterium Pan216]